MDYLTSEDDPNIMEMESKKFLDIKLLLDDTSVRERFLGALPEDVFSNKDHQKMDTDGCKGDMTKGKWLLFHLGNCGGRVSDLIYWFEKINLERALVYLKEEEPLQIIEQPEPDINVNEGERFFLTCKASSYPHPEYQWFKDDEDLLLEGEEQVLSIPFAKLEDSGVYRCQVSKINADSSVSRIWSAPATVVVKPCKSTDLAGFSKQNLDKEQPNNKQVDREKIQAKPKESYEQNILPRKCSESEKIFILKQPRSQREVPQGSFLLLKCIATASHPVNYQWYRNGQLLKGQTSSLLLVDEMFPDQKTGSKKYEFVCHVYNEYGVVISKCATIELSESDDRTIYVAEDKFAFLIANDKYEAYEEDLVTPAVDAADLAKLLKSINFKVIVLRNLSLKEMKSTLQAFCRLLRPGSYAVVFFAGHGFDYYRQTYLQPIDCSENLLPEESMCTEYILQQIQETSPALIVLLIDACRKKPPELGYVQVEMYDAPMENNTVYGYATSFLDGAYESPERNSFFVKHLKKYITHDKSIQEIIFLVQKGLDAEPQARSIQHPEIKSTLSAARKLCDELRDPLDTTAYQLPCWFYQERNSLEKQTEMIEECKCYFIIEIKDHMDIYLNGIDVILYIFVKEDANLHKLCKSLLLFALDTPGLQVRKGVQLKNIQLDLGQRNLILKEEVLELQRFQNPEIKPQLLFKYDQSQIIPINFPFTLEKIRGMEMFFR